MNKVSENQINFIGEQDGDIERSFKIALNNVFIKSEKCIRAYLVQAQYTNSSLVSVILCIKTQNGEDEAIVDACTHVFKSSFSCDQYLDIIFISDNQELKIRQVCCPFYTSEGFRILTPDFYLFSSEGYNLDKEPINCYKRKRLYGDHMDGYMLCDIDPAIIGQSYGLGSSDINQIIIASRFEGMSLFHITEWPTYVYVMRLLTQDIEYKNTIIDTDYELIAWAEIYKDKTEIM